VARSKFIPRRQPDKFLRWDYDYVEIGEVDIYDGVLNEEYMPAKSDDEWTIGESSSIASDVRDRSPSMASSEPESWSKEGH
jgi:hypothetical protein